ncbi:MAG: hypothetical protein ACOVLC_09310 [Flavobacterium sp.]
MNKTLKFLMLAGLFQCGLIWAQKPCEYSAQVNDSIGKYVSLKDVLVYEQIFGSSEKYVFLSLQNVNGTPLLNFQWVQKSNQFIPAHCLSNSSKLHIQLESGKIISLIYTDNENCGTKLNDGNQKATRILTGNFLFLKGSVEALKTSKITMIRLSMGSDNKDFIIRDEVNSELLKTTSYPSTFFMNYLDCVLNLE